MSGNEVWTQGTQLYLLGPKSDGSGVLEIMEVAKVTNVTPGSAPRKEIPTTTLRERYAETSIDGLAQPGEASVAINLSTDEPSHHYLLWAYENRIPLKWVIGMSDGWLDDIDDGIKPELEDDNFKLSDERSWQQFAGRVNDFPPEFSADDIVKYNLPIKTSGRSIPKFKKLPTAGTKSVTPPKDSTK